MCGGKAIFCIFFSEFFRAGFAFLRIYKVLEHGDLLVKYHGKSHDTKEVKL